MAARKRATKADVLKLAKALHVEIEDVLTSYGGTISAEAPRGRTFACDPGLHGLVADWYKGEKAEAWAELLDRMSFGTGVELCEAEDCDVCEDEDEKAIEQAEATRDRMENR